MKKRFIILFATILFFSFKGYTQTINGSPDGLPLKVGLSPTFGKDIIINDIPSEDQRNVSICSAFNGWLYACYWMPNATGYEFTYYILRSSDNGITWTQIYSHFFDGEHAGIKKMEIMACGDSLSNIKLFLGWIIYNYDNHFGQGMVFKFNGVTGDLEGEILDDQFSDMHDMALSSDYSYPAINSSPHSIAVLYSRTNSFFYNVNELIFCSSSNGGVSFDHSQIISTSNTRLYRNVDLEYGRCQTKSEGRYFAVWDDDRNTQDSIGHIYTAHTEPFFNSAMTTPVCLDSLHVTTINKCRKPIIACQSDNADNDSSDLTQIVSFERFDVGSNSFLTETYFNKRSTLTNFFTELSFLNSAYINKETDIAYNPFSKKFMVTYFDATNKRLPFLTNDVNLTIPNVWNVVNQGYNDNNNLIAPNPKVRVNFENQDGMNAWIAEGTGGKGISMFDSPYSTYTGFIENEERNILNCRVFPNPCNYSVSIDFELPILEKVTIEICNLMGQPLGVVTNKVYPKGTNQVSIDLSNFTSGCYLYQLRAGDVIAKGKINVIH